MNLDLYYLIPLMPELDLRKKPPLSSREFIDMCRQSLSIRNITSLEQCYLYEFDDQTSFITVKEWYNSERYLRNQMVEFRAERLRKDPDVFYRGDYFSGKILDEVQTICRLQEPAAMAEVLYKKRWHLLDHLQCGHFFNMEWLSIYYLKLQLLEKHFKYSKEAGKKVLQTYLQGNTKS